MDLLLHGALFDVVRELGGGHSVTRRVQVNGDLNLLPFIRDTWVKVVDFRMIFARLKLE